MSREKDHSRDATQRLQEWLVRDAYPFWAAHGVDLLRGGFHERLDGTQPTQEPRRARVQPRQVAAFARSRELGWGGDAERLARHGLDYLLLCYRRPDGLFRALIEPDGTPVDDRALLYDQAFALLGFAESHRVVESPSRYQQEALRLRAVIERLLKREGPGFETCLPPRMPRSSNAHMHLLEACLAWQEVRADDTWQAIADEIVALALSRFIDSESGVLREHFTATWEPLPGLRGRIIEPGHHFEWAWLLFRWAGRRHPQVHQTALRLIDIGERHGVQRGVAINALLDDFSVHDAGARLWPQTERIKAAARAASLTGDPRYWEMASSAADSLLRYLRTDVRGSWLDRLTQEGLFIDEPAPASSFYHIVAAIAELVEATSASR